MNIRYGGVLGYMVWACDGPQSLRRSCRPTQVVPDSVDKILLRVQKFKNTKE